MTHTIEANVEEGAFIAARAIANAPDMIEDDLPSNTAYLTGSKSGQMLDSQILDSTLISDVAGETIRLFEPTGLDIRDNHMTTARYAEKEARAR